MNIDPHQLVIKSDGDSTGTVVSHNGVFVSGVTKVQIKGIDIDPNPDEPKNSFVTAVITVEQVRLGD